MTLVKISNLPTALSVTDATDYVPVVTASGPTTKKALVSTITANAVASAVATASADATTKANAALASAQASSVQSASLAAGVATFLTAPSGANLATALTSALPASKGGTGITALGTGIAAFLAATYVTPFTIASRISPLDANHLHAWELGDASGNFVDTGSSASKVNLTAAGTPLYGRSGPVGGATNFNRSDTGTAVTSNGSALISAFSDLPSTNLTLEVWFRSERGLGRYIMGADFSGQRTFQVWDNGGLGQIALSVNSGGAALVSLTSIECMTPGTWRHFAAVFDTTGSKLIMYLDGEVVSQATYNTPVTWFIDGSSKMWVAGSAANPGFSGSMSRMRLSNIARSQAYCQAVYKLGMGY